MYLNMVMQKSISQVIMQHIWEKMQMLMQKNLKY